MGIEPDVNKTILIALDKYLEKEVREEDLKKIEKIKAQEVREIKTIKKAEKPIFSWDLSKKKKKEGK